MENKENNTETVEGLGPYHRGKKYLLKGKKKEREKSKINTHPSIKLLRKRVR